VSLTEQRRQVALGLRLGPARRLDVLLPLRADAEVNREYVRSDVPLSGTSVA
jgi:hypothetical protein